jgi:CheY-like chemotaxis protein
MLTSAGQTADCERRRQIGLAACLTKPVKQSELLNTIVTTLSNSAAPVVRPARAAQPAPTERSKSMRILLTEDNLVNQRLALRLLEKQGHTVAVANNGREALSALTAEAFDLVLMDVQMPEMDGLEATAAIRAKERGTRTHLPIVAMTAGAMTEDKERCLAAGMDDYVSKPLKTDDLMAILERIAIDKTPRHAATLPPTA